MLRQSVKVLTFLRYRQRVCLKHPLSKVGKKKPQATDTIYSTRVGVIVETYSRVIFDPWEKFVSSKRVITFCLQNSLIVR